MILGYPSPVIVNWGNTYDLDDDSKWLGNSHMSKITGTLEYLDFMSRKEAYEADRLMDDDLVLVVDAFDIWFQLPPEVLLQRYHRTIQAANARLAEQWDSHGNSSVPMPMEQTILISPQKRCWPGPSSHSDLSCDALPESPVREDLYGPDTDEDPENNYQHSRPRYINSGSIMGPVRDMRRFFRRANDKTENHYSDGTQMSSDQGVFGEVWGEQEVWRTWAREQHRVGADKTGDRAQTLIQSDFEYHVSLDYYEQLFVATVFHEEDVSLEKTGRAPVIFTLLTRYFSQGDIVKLNNRTAIEFESRYRNIPTRLDGLPDDIKGSPLPRQVAAVGLGQGHRRDWGDMPLYADFYSATVPAVIHHNAHINNLKTRRETWWDRIWFFPYLRQLMEERLQPGSLQVLAAITTKSGSNDITYRALLSDETKRKPRLFKSADFKSGVQEAETFDGICSDWDPEREKKRRWFDEIFRDGNGPI